MSTEFINDQWRLPNEENKSKVSNYSMDFLTTTRIPDITGLGLGTSVDTFSISLWFNKSNMNYGIVFSTYSGTGSYITSGVAINLYTDGTIGLYNGAARTTTSAQYSINTWYNLVVTSDGTTVKMYVNGSQVTLNSTTAVARDFTNVWINSAKYSASNFGIVGKIDGVAIFDYALSSSQVTTLYGSSSTGIGNPMSLSPKPVAYYPLGDQDAFNGSNYLVPNSSLKDYVFDFDGSNDYIDTNSTFNTLTSFTVSAWFKADDAAGTVRSIVSTRVNGITTSKGFDIYISANVLTARVYNNGATEVTQAFTDTSNWHNVVMTYNGTTLELFLDNSSTGTATGNYDNSGGRNLTIGKWGPVIGASYYFDGLISNVSIFNTALSTPNIETLYNNGSPLTSMSGFTSLQGWWKLDASATFDSSTNTWTIPDDSTNSNTGTSSGMTQANLVQSDLSFTSGYSPYALSFDAASSDYIDVGTTLNSMLEIGDSFSISAWVNFGNTAADRTIISNFTSAIKGIQFRVKSNESIRIIFAQSSSVYLFVDSSSLAIDTWHHAVFTYDGSNTIGGLKLYINSILDNNTNGTSGTITTITSTDSLKIGAYTSGQYFDGSISNVSIWNTELTSAQVSEIYSEGVPQNLLNHSAVSSLVSWWQLGSNSSFNSSLNQWTCIDEKGTKTGESSQTFNEDAIVDGVGSYANGTSSGMGGDEVVGDAPYSTANALSVNMDVEDRVTDTPS